MSPPTPGKLQHNGHAARAVITAKRRIEIWDQVYNIATKPPTCGKWCTRDELIAASLPSGKKRITPYNVDELTEVMRGKKHKKALGVDSSKVDGEWLYRFNQPGAEKALSFKLSSPPPSPVTPMASTKKRTTVRPPVTKKSTGATPSKPKPKATPAKPGATSSKPVGTSPKPEGTSSKSRATPSKPGGTSPKLGATSPKAGGTSPKSRTKSPKPGGTSSKSRATSSKSKAKATPVKAKRNTPLRPRPKSPRSASKSPVAVRASTRKRAAATAEPAFAIPLRSAMAKKKRSRLPSEKRKSVGYAQEDEVYVMGAGEGVAVNVGGAEGGDGGGGNWCTIM